MNFGKIHSQARCIAAVAAVLLAFLFPAVLSAQSSFTDRLRSESKGEGKITLIQDAEIDALVNGTKQVKIAVPDTISESRAKIGYRIQIFSGGNSRADKAQAEKVQMLCRQQFPQLATYVQFHSPRWTCRVGNFPNAAEAEKYLSAMRDSGKFKGITLVRCKIASN